MVKSAVILGFSLALLGVNIYVCTQFGYLVSQVRQLKVEIDELKRTTREEIAVLHEKTLNSTKSASKSVAAMQDELAKARAAAAALVGQAKVEATAHADEIAKNLADEIASDHRKQLEESQKQIKTELSVVKEAASSADAKINQVHSEVTTVRTQIAAEKSATQNQATELKRVIGELGIQTDRIATNKKELQVLKSLGERNYFEFTLAKGRENTRVADVHVSLKRLDAKRNRYTVEVTTNDRRFQRKDRNINEPVQFYVNKTRQPHELVVNELYELVINEIKDDSVSGYLSTPKVQVVSSR